MVAILIYWPGLVTAFLDKPSDIDPTRIQINMPSEESDPLKFFEDQDRNQGQPR